MSTRRSRASAPRLAPHPGWVEHLLEDGLDRPHLDEALALRARTGEHLGRILVAQRSTTPEQLARALARDAGMAYVEAPLPVDEEAVGPLPENVIRAHRLVPLGSENGGLRVATSNPFDEDALCAARETAGGHVVFAVATEPAITAALDRLYADRDLEDATSGHHRKRPEQSAYRVLSRGQQVVGIALALATVLGLVFALVPTLVALTLVSIVFYLAILLFKAGLITRSLQTGVGSGPTDAEVAALDETLLPPYTILVPLYHEVAVLPGLVAGIDALDYPSTKLDVKLLLEADDVETREALEQLPLGPHYEVVVVADGLPKTKPKACNYGLSRARGEYVVIYDAEDRPDGDQLKKAVMAFREAPPDVVCVQAKLNYWNSDQNALTRWFTAEYTHWFDLFLPGLDAAGMPIPLGGTSNHFPVRTLRALDAWDPFNVTEDADLGLRLARAGFRTSIVDSTTYEEANSRTGNWIRQRSRWTKGYVQTWLVHMRHPVALWRELGARNWLAFQLVVGGTPLVLLLNPIFWGIWVGWLLSQASLIQAAFPGPLFYLAAFNLLIGNFVFIYLMVAGSLRRNQPQLVKYALLAPLYWALMSVAAWKGLWQLVTRPSYWEKTTHGLALPDGEG